jgi:hypothetical protein
MSLKRHLRVAFLGLVLLIAVFFGLPMRPKDIEELLHAQRQTKVEDTTQNEEQDFNEDEKILTQ